MMKKVSMKDIAKEVGVSVALVSYVLNGKFQNRINADTAEKIKRIAKQYNYTPNQIAKSLKSAKTYTLGLIVADISNVFYSEIARHIEEEARRFGYNVLFASAYEDAFRFKNILDVFISKQVDGLILAVPDGADSYISYLDDLGIPYVIIDREFDSIDATKIINIDNYNSSIKVSHHVFEAGFKNPAVISLKSNLKHLIERKNGFVDAAKLLYHREIVAFDIIEKDLESDIENVVLTAINDYEVDFFYLLTNRIAMSTLGVLAKNAIAVPDTVGIVCFDQADAYTIFGTTLTYVKQPLQEMSKTAVRRLLKPEDPEVLFKYDTQLIIGKSSVLSD